MQAQLKTTLSKWGNSQGLRVPKEVCELLGIGPGAQASMSVDVANSTLTLRFERPQRSFQRTRNVSIEELFEGYDGPYEPPSDWPTVASEVDWGNSVGKELW